MSDTETTTQPAATEVDPAATGGTQPPQGELGEGGKKALQAEREARRTAEREAAEIRARLEALEQQTARTDEQRAALLAARNTHLIAAEIKAAAKGVLHNPALALKLIDPSQFTVGDDGAVDASAIEAAVQSLVESEPYLAARSDPARVAGSADAGARTTPPEPSLDERIAEAQAGGDWRTVIQLQTQKIAGKAV